MMNVQKRVIKELQKNKKLNPFSERFDVSELKTLYFSIKEGGEKTTDPEKKQQQQMAMDTCRLIRFMNEQFNDFYAFLKDVFTSQGFTYEEFLHILFIRSNNLYRYALTEQKKKLVRLNPSGNYSWLDLNNQEIELASEGAGTLMMKDALDSEIDALATVLKYLFYYKSYTFTKNIKRNKLLSLTTLPDLSGGAQIYYTLKTVFERLRYYNGTLEINKKKRTADIYISFDKEEYTRERVNRIIMMERIFKRLSISDSRATESIYMAHLLRKGLKEIQCKNGYIVPVLDQSPDYDIQWYISTHCALYKTYYPFFESKGFPDIPELTVEKCLAIYIAFTYLMVRTALLPDVSDHLSTWQEMYEKSSFRITSEVLIKYLIEKTGLGKAVIDKFLKLYSADTLDKINLWNTPLISYKDDYIFSLYPCSNGMTINLIDQWLKKGGFDEKKRGELFEDYIREKNGLSR